MYSAPRRRYSSPLTSVSQNNVLVFYVYHIGSRPHHLVFQLPLPRAPPLLPPTLIHGPGRVCEDAVALIKKKIDGRVRGTKGRARTVNIWRRK